MLVIPFVTVIILLAGSSVHGYSTTGVPSDPDAQWIDNYGLNGRIVNGTKAALRQFPHQVSLRRSYNSRHFCGGSLIHESYVVTAAHCMFMNGNRILPWTIMVVAGELELSKNTSTGQKRGVEEINIHNEFNSTTLQNDITLLTLSKPFQLTPEVNIAPLSEGTPLPNSFCSVAGWGYPSQDFPVLNNDLMFVDLPIVSRDVCKKLLVNITDLPPGMMCAGYADGMKDACQGDSGGGMVCGHVLAGVVSGGEGCALPSFPGVYSDVYFYKNWILANMKTAVIINLQSSSAEKVSSSSSRPWLFSNSQGAEGGHSIFGEKAATS